MSSVDLSIIIVNYHSADYVVKCLQSIREQTKDLKYEVIVVDNASYDGCRERLARDFPKVRYVQSDYNLGFGRANNLGVRHATGAVLLFLNPDTELKDRAVDRLYEQFCRLYRPGAVGCRLLNSDGSFQTSCVQSFPTILNQVLDAGALQRHFPKSGLWGSSALFAGDGMTAEVEMVSGACLMIRRDVFDRIGNFSPEYFMYGEDVDLCFKTRQAGLRNYYVADSVIVHHGGGSTNHSLSNFTSVMMREAIHLFLRKSRGGLYAAFYRVGLIKAAVARLAILTVARPFLIARGKKGVWSAAVRKWLAILRWGVGLEHWVRHYDHPRSSGIADITDET